MNNVAKRPLLLLCLLLGLGAPALSTASDLPEYRPALLTRGPRSLINLVDVQSLMKRGQGSGVVMFDFGVSSLGFARGFEYYRGTPNTDKLGLELVRRCDQAQFEPAIFHHNRVSVYVCATAVFVVKDGKPHIQIYLNQEQDDLLKGHDFIAPQFVATPGLSKFRTFYWPPNSSGHEGLAAATIDVDETGHVVHSQVAYEYPPKMGFGAEVAGRVIDAVFIPAFRDGKQVSARFTWPMMFNRHNYKMSTG